MRTVSGNPIKNQINSMKTSLLLIAFTIIYNWITLSCINSIRQDQSSSLGYGIMIIIFWIAAGITLAVLMGSKKIEVKTFLDKILVVCSTPIPLLLVISIIFITRSPSLAS